MAEYRNVLALIFAVGFLQLAGGLLGVLTPLGLSNMSLGAALVGAVAALHAAGFMAGSWVAPKMIALFGNIRVYSAAAAINAATILTMALAADPVSWSLIRLIQGVAFAWMFTSIESWMSSSTPATSRGGVTGFYHVVAKAALLVGPFFAAGAAALAPEPLLFAGIFAALSLVPVCLTRREQPSPPSTDALSLSDLYTTAPAALFGAFMAGLIGSGTTALLPLFAQSLAAPGETATAVAAQVAAAAMIGGLLSQWPAGRISDRIDRRLVVAVMALVGAVSGAALAVGYTVMDRTLLLVVLAIWGAGSLSIYGISVAHGIDRADADEIPSLMSGYLFVWALGSVLGPPVVGVVMRTPLGQSGLFVFAAVASLILAAAMVIRSRVRDPVEDADTEPWEITAPLSMASGDLDPRSPDTVDESGDSPISSAGAG